MAEEYGIYKYASQIYYGLLIVSLSIILGFSYLSYKVYSSTVGTNLVVLSYIIIIPVFAAIILLIILVLMGKNTVASEVLGE